VHGEAVGPELRADAAQGEAARDALASALHTLAGGPNTKPLNNKPSTPKSSL